MSNLLAEKALRRDVVAWLSRLQQQRRLAAIWLLSANGVYFPRHFQEGTHDRDVEEQVIRRCHAVLRPLIGEADLFLGWRTGAGVMELKRAPQRDLLEPNRHPKGRPSRAQEAFRERCVAIGIRHAYCHSLGEVEDALVAWGVLSEPESARQPYRRIVAPASAGWPP